MILGLDPTILISSECLYVYLEKLVLQTTRPYVKNRTLTDSSDQSRKTNYNLCSNWVKSIRIKPMTDSYPNFCPCFQFMTNQRKGNMFPQSIIQDSLLLVILQFLLMPSTSKKGMPETSLYLSTRLLHPPPPPPAFAFE